VWQNNLITKGGLVQEILQDVQQNLARILQDLARNAARSCKNCCKILQEMLQDLARNPARSCKTSSKILHNNLAPAYARILQDSCTSKQSCKISSGKILQDLQESGQITCKTARLVQVLQDDLQDFQLSWSKICSKILQEFFLHGPCH